MVRLGYLSSKEIQKMVEWLVVSPNRAMAYNILTTLLVAFDSVIPESSGGKARKILAMGPTPSITTPSPSVRRSTARSSSVSKVEEAEEEKKARNEAAQFGDLCTTVKDALGDKIEKVIVSNHITDFPCALVTSHFG